MTPGEGSFVWVTPSRCPAACLPGLSQTSRALGKIKGIQPWPGLTSSNQRNPGLLSVWCLIIDCLPASYLNRHLFFH